jgi:tRNA threonylcarbamoyladenosine biosynthesis protein TsaB
VTPPLLLAFDVSTHLGSVALGCGDGLLGERFLLDPRGQAAWLVPAISEVMDEAGVKAPDIDGVVVGRGPGSFTGVRIGAATARGLAAALAVPVWPLSSLAAAALSPPDAPRSTMPPEADPAPGVGIEPTAILGHGRGGPVCVLFDAGGDRVYAGTFGRSEGGLDVLAEPWGATIAELLGSEPPPDTLFVGDGALRHARTLDAAGYRVLAFPAGIPTAAALLRLHALRPEIQPEDAGSRWQPEYVRGSSARPPRAWGRVGR